MTPEKTQKKTRKDPSESQKDIETASSIIDENQCLSERAIEVISSNIENRKSKTQRDTEHGHRTILGQKENLSSKVGNFSIATSELSCFSSAFEPDEVITREFE